MKLMKRFRNLFTKTKTKSESVKETASFITIETIESKFNNDDLLGAAKDLKSLLEAYGKRKSKNHRHKGRVFIAFILSNKDQDQKNIGYTHWQNLIEYIRLGHKTIYPYHKKNIGEAISFFMKKIKGLSEIKIQVSQ